MKGSNEPNMSGLKNLLVQICDAYLESHLGVSERLFLLLVSVITAQASVEGMEYDRVWTVHMDDTIDLHSQIIATAIIIERRRILK